MIGWQKQHLGLWSGHIFIFLRLRALTNVHTPLDSYGRNVKAKCRMNCAFKLHRKCLVYRVIRRRTIITARKRSLRRFCFYTCLSVILFAGGCLPQCILGYTSPEADTPGKQTPWKQTPPGIRHPPTPTVHAVRYGHQAGGTHPTGMHTCFINVKFTWCGNQKCKRIHTKDRSNQPVSYFLRVVGKVLRHVDVTLFLSLFVEV